MKKIREYDYLILGLILASVSFNLFLAPYNLAAGGIAGISLFAHKLFNIDESTFIFLGNIFLLVLSYLLLGQEKTKRSLLGSLLYPLFISLTSFITTWISFDNLETVVIAILAGILSGIGSGLIFKGGFTSGGTDILNQIMEKYMHISIGTSIILVDGTITLLSGFIFGFNNMVYAIITLIILSIFNNKILLGINNHKSIYIFSNKYPDIKKYLHQELKYDSTDFDIQGGFTNKKGKAIFTVVNAKDYYKLKLALKIIDPKVFIIATNSYQQVNANIQIRS